MVTSWKARGVVDPGEQCDLGQRPTARPARNRAAPAGRVWTHTTAAGTAVPDDHHCAQWTSGVLNLQAAIGLSGVAPDSPDSPDVPAWTNERWWTRFNEKSCNLNARLYCFEDGYSLEG